jgi:hypothetical protein
MRVPDEFQQARKEEELRKQMSSSGPSRTNSLVRKSSIVANPLVRGLSKNESAFEWTERLQNW